MTLDKGTIYNGFKLIEKRKVKELNSTALIFTHIKTGARLLKLENADDNKVFSIGFKTPPEKSTGVAHIIEHSVLCGSEKFRSKEPFVELLKGSLNTFLNAMTFADKTIYPVASRNNKDFHNLMDVYLDAVLNPLIYQEPLIFMQEGWHYEMNSQEDELQINGVVYNEMKGVYSSPDSLLYRYIPSSLFPDTTYGVDSGGDPDVIPELSYEEFIAFHKKYYHPSNSYIFLYGDGNLQEELSLIDSYINGYEPLKELPEVSTQAPFKEMRELSIPYTIASDEDEENKTYLSLNYAVGNSLDTELTLAFQILTYLLLQNPAAPLKKALIEAEIGKTVIGDFDSSSKQCVFTVVVKNSEEAKKDRFQAVVKETLSKLVQQGIDKELIEASINYQEFLLREGDFRGYPKGIIYYISAMENWLHGGDPLASLMYDEALNNIKRALKENYFEELIGKYILNNKHSSYVVLKPEKGLGERHSKELQEKLEAYRASLSTQEINNIIEMTAKLRERQQSVDSEEVLSTIPMLTLEDVDKKAEWLPLELKKVQNVKVLFHEVFTNKIAYLKLIFNTSSIAEELIPYTRLLGDLLAKISTENYSYEALANKINIHTGGITFNVSSSVDGKKLESFIPQFIIKAKSLVSKLPELCDLIAEIIRSSKFDERIRLLALIREQKSRMEGIIYNSGNSIASLRVLSYITSKGVYDERTKGLSYYKFLSHIEKNYDSMYPQIVEALEKVRKTIFNVENLSMSYTSEANNFADLEGNINKILVSLGTVAETRPVLDLKPVKNNEGLTTEAKVLYVAKAFNYRKFGYQYNGALRVIENILTLDYLWNKVRVIGGAYGVSVNVLKDGNVYISSYRDPKLSETIKAYDEIGDYLRNLDCGEREITKYVLGTISKLDFPLTPSMIADISDSRYFAEITYEDLQKERNEILSLDKERIKFYSNLFIKGMEENYLSALGNQEKIKNNREIFMNVINVF